MKATTIKIKLLYTLKPELTDLGFKGIFSSTEHLNGSLYFTKNMMLISPEIMFSKVMWK